MTLLVSVLMMLAVCCEGQDQMKAYGNGKIYLGRVEYRTAESIRFVEPTESRTVQAEQVDSLYIINETLRSRFASLPAFRKKMKWMPLSGKVGQDPVPVPVQIAAAVQESSKSNPAAGALIAIGGAFLVAGQVINLQAIDLASKNKGGKDQAMMGTYLSMIGGACITTGGLLLIKF